MTDDVNAQKPASSCHPEEMRATWDLKIGRNIALQGSARWTPAGVITAGIAASAVLLSISALARAMRRP